MQLKSADLLLHFQLHNTIVCGVLKNNIVLTLRFINENDEEITQKIEIELEKRQIEKQSKNRYQIFEVFIILCYNTSHGADQVSTGLSGHGWQVDGNL